MYYLSLFSSILLDKKSFLDGNQIHLIVILISQDKSLSDGIFFLELLRSVQPRAVNWSLVTKGQTGMVSSIYMWLLLNLVTLIIC